MERLDFANCVLELESLEHCLVKNEWTSKIRKYYDKAFKVNTLAKKIGVNYCMCSEDGRSNKIGDILFA